MISWQIVSRKNVLMMLSEFFTSVYVFTSMKLEIRKRMPDSYS